jgi:predicted glycosyltransferase
VRYTGYVVDADLGRPPTGTAGAGEVIVSAGGGAVGAPLLDAALSARPLTALAGHRWRLLAGPNLPAADFERITARARGAGDDAVVFERSRQDFTTLLANCTLSVSQGGYNTVIETLCFAERAVIVPYAGGLETEQGLRAGLLAERGVFEIVDEDALSAAALAEAIARRMAGPSIRQFPRCDTDGRARTLHLLETMLAERRRPPA